MKFVPAKCTQCNANLEVDPAKDAAMCKYCETPFVVEKAIKHFNKVYNIQNQTINVYKTIHKPQPPRPPGSLLISASYKKIGWFEHYIIRDADNDGEILEKLKPGTGIWFRIETKGSFHVSLSGASNTETITAYPGETVRFKLDYKDSFFKRTLLVYRIS